MCIGCSCNSNQNEVGCKCPLSAAKITGTVMQSTNQGRTLITFHLPVSFNWSSLPSLCLSIKELCVTVMCVISDSHTGHPTSILYGSRVGFEDD